jgi:alanyl-tRNA synthetase
VDVPDAAIGWDELERAELLANRIIFENRPIKTYFIGDEEIETVSFRRPPKVSGRIRVVEVAGFDYSACGGTHCPHTGMVGSLKIVKMERKNQKLRLHFVAGQQALAAFQQYHRIVSGLGAQLSTGPDNLVEILGQQAEQLRQAQKEVDDLQAELLAFDARKLARQARRVEGIRLATATYPNRSAATLRELAKLLQGEENLAALLLGYDGRKLSLVVSCAQETGLSARELLARLLVQIGGRGGGDARLAQGGGEATPEQVYSFFTSISDHLRVLRRRLK